MRDHVAFTATGALALAAILAASCDDGSCDDATNECDQAGAVRCAADGAAVETCSADECGVLLWYETESCTGLRACVPDGGARCECDDECDRTGASVCDGDVARYCSLGTDGCLYWRDEDCSRSGQTCDDSMGSAACGGGCEPDCFRIDATRCRSAMELEACVETEGGCLMWQVTELCDRPLTACDDASGVAECVACAATCPAEGGARCQGGDVETCTDPGNECLAWVRTVDCPPEQPCGVRGAETGCFGETDCADGDDEDLDLLVDCDDPDCFGLTPCDAAETNCGDGADNDGDGLIDCADDDCAAQAATPAASEAIFTEVLAAPSTADAGAGEFVELLNTSGRDLDLACCALRAGGAAIELGAIAVPAGGRAVLAGSDDPALNGGIDGAVAVAGGLGLDDAAAVELALECGGVVVDSLPLAGGAWPAGGPGVSMQLSSWASSALSNDAGAVWCDSAAAFGDGDLGTPGLPNEPCPATVFLEQDFEADPGWVATGGWEWGAPDPAFAEGPPACAAGAGCAGTDMDGVYGSLCAGMACALSAPAIDLSGATAPVLSFDLWLDTELGADGAGLVASGADLAWAPVEPLTPPYVMPEDAPTLWSGALSTGVAWRPVVADLSPWAGQAEVHLAWVLTSDLLGARAGAYVDDVVVWEP